MGPWYKCTKRRSAQTSTLHSFNILHHSVSCLKTVMHCSCLFKLIIVVDTVFAVATTHLLYPYLVADFATKFFFFLVFHPICSTVFARKSSSRNENRKETSLLRCNIFSANSAVSVQMTSCTLKVNALKMPPPPFPRQSVHRLVSQCRSL